MPPIEYSVVLNQRLGHGLVFCWWWTSVDERSRTTYLPRQHAFCSKQKTLCGRIMRAGNNPMGARCKSCLKYERWQIANSSVIKLADEPRKDRA